MIIVFARQLNHLCRNTQSWHKKKLLHSDLWMPTFVQQDLWKAMSAAGIAAVKRCFLLNGTYITETVPWAAPLRACGLPDAVFLAISATSACRDLHLEGEEGGGKRRFSSTALPPVPEVADGSSVNVSLLRHRGRGGMQGAPLQLGLATCVHAPCHQRGREGAFGTPGSSEAVPDTRGEQTDTQTDRPPSLCSQHSSAGTLLGLPDPARPSLPAQRCALGDPRDCTERQWWPLRDTCWNNLLEILHRIWSTSELTLTAKAGALTAKSSHSLHLKLCLCLDRSERANVWNHSNLPLTSAESVTGGGEG